MTTHAENLLALKTSIKEDTVRFRKGLFPRCERPVNTSTRYMAIWEAGGITQEIRFGIDAGVAAWRELIPVACDFPKSAKRVALKGGFSFTTNQHFHFVLEQCEAMPRTGEQAQRWIGSCTRGLLNDLYEEGRAHSVEIYKDHRLVAGLIGFQMGAIFVALTKFHTENNAGNAADIVMIANLYSGDFAYIDVIRPSENSRKYGGWMVTRDQYDKIRSKAFRTSHSFRTWQDPKPLSQFIEPFLRKARNMKCDRPQKYGRHIFVVGANKL